MIKPCPECGSSRVNPKISMAVWRSERHYIKCGNCGFSCEMCQTKDEAVMLWNSIIIINRSGLYMYSQGFEFSDWDDFKKRNEE